MVSRPDEPGVVGLVLGIFIGTMIGAAIVAYASGWFG